MLSLFLTSKLIYKKEKQSEYKNNKMTESFVYSKVKNYKYVYTLFNYFQSIYEILHIWSSFKFLGYEA